MTLNEAIEHAEEVASENENKCKACADEHRQLAEWLKDYKRLLEQNNEEIYKAGYEDGVHDGYYSSSIEDGIEEKHFGKSYQEQPTSDCVSKAEVSVGNQMRMNWLLDSLKGKDISNCTIIFGTCKDCKHWCKYDGLDTCKLTLRARSKDFYCADFEKAR